MTVMTRGKVYSFDGGNRSCRGILMVAYSFKERFAEPILNGTKGGTIRASRKGPLRAATGGHAKPGEELQLYTDMRTRNCRLK
jgi:hypothetical protein